MTEDEVDFSKMSLEDRCVHKAWKARLSAFEELIKVFGKIDDEKSPEWNKYTGFVRKFPADSNAAAQEKGLEATLLFMENSSQAGRIVGEVMSGVISKCLTAPKARSKELAASITMMCIEIEKYEVVQDELMKGMDAKNPKVVAACITLLTKALREYGPKVLNLKTLVKKIGPLSEDRDKIIREENKKMTVELYRWIGAGFKPQLSSLKPVVMQELEEEFDKIGNEKPSQTRFLRSQQAKREKLLEATGDAEEVVVEDNAGPEIDPYDLLEPVDILSKLPKDFYEKCEAKKWQERKEALEILEKLVANPKLEPGDYAELVRVLKRMIAKDTNVVVVALAGKCVNGLALGLKKKFTPYAPSCISTILEKFKEKKPAVLTAMREASDACFAVTTLEQIQEDAVEALGNKNPAVKAETSLLLARAFAKTPLKTLNDKKLMKLYFTALLANLNESDPVVRDASAEALGVALKALGEKPLNPYLADLDPIKLAKVKEFAEKAVVMVQKSVGVAKAAPKPAAASAKSNESGSGSANKGGPAVVKRKTPAGNTGTYVKRPPSMAPADPFSEDLEQGPSSRTSPVPEDDRGSRVDISHEITESLIEKLSDKNWKLRDETLDKISAILAKAKNIQPNLGELPVALGARLQDSNRNIAANAFLLCQNLAAALGPHCKNHLRTLLPYMLTGLSDQKTNVRSTVVACLNAWAENASVEEFFQGEYIADALKGNSPYVKIELFNWLNTQLPPLKHFNKEDLNACVPHLYACLEDRNVEVRKSAQDAVLSFMIQLGFDNMTKTASRLKPSSKTVVQGLLDKARPNLPAKPPISTQTNRANTQLPKNIVPTTQTYKVDKTFNKSYDSGQNSRNDTPESSSSQIGKPKAGGRVPAKVKSSPTGKKIPDEHVGLNLPRNNQKQQRILDELKLKILRWQFTAPREEFVDLLKELMTNGGVSKNLISLMFNQDFKFHLRALDILCEEYAMGIDTTMFNFDLILKWLSLRFFDTNPSVLIKSLEYVTMCLQGLSDQAYQMTDLEGSSFVPYLLNKIGDPKDNIRQSVHGILRLLHNVTHPNKIFGFVLEGLKSKNARQRSECLDELAHMISSYSLTICVPSAASALKDIARQISDRDNGVRNSALNCVVEAYFLTGDKIYKMIGQLTDKDQSLLDERIKRMAKQKDAATHLNAPRLSNPPLYPISATNSAPPNSMIPNVPSPPLDSTIIMQMPKADSSPGGFGINKFTGAPRNDIRMPEESIPLSRLPAEDQGEDEDDFPDPPPRGKKWTCPPEYRVDFEAIDNMYGPKDLEPMSPLQLFDTDIEYLKHEAPVTLPKRSVVSQVQSAKTNTVVPQRACQSIDLVVTQIGSSDLRKVLEAIVQVEGLIGDQAVANVMVTRADHLLLMVTTQMRRLQPLLQSQRSSNIPEINKVYRCIVHLLQTFYKGSLLPLQVTKDILRDLIYHLLLLIVDPCITALTDSASIVRHINVLVVRVIEKSDPNATIPALVRLLNEALRMNSQPRLLELTMKCQWKLLKQFGIWVKNQTYDFDVRSCLQEFNAFFRSHPLNSFNTGNETPLKTIKTIFHALVLNLGPDVFITTMQSMPELKDTEAEKYLNKLIMREMAHRKTTDNSDEGSSPYSHRVPDNALTNNSNNNIQDFFSSLPNPNEAKGGNDRAGVYLKRLSMIQKRGGLDTASSLSDEYPKPDNMEF